MKIEEVNKIRLALETPEHSREHDNYCFEAENILNTYELALKQGQSLPIDSVSGSLPFPVAILDGLKVDVKFKDGGLIIKKSNCNSKN